MSAKLLLKIDASPDALLPIEEAVESLALQENWPLDLIFSANLVIEELALNVVNHAYQGKTGEFDLIVTSEDDAITIEIIDNGPPFNLLTDAPDPSIDASIEDRPIGGLGLHLVKSMMDELNYAREQDKNHLTLVKRRDG